MIAPSTSFVIAKRVSSEVIVAIADAGTFDTLADNFAALRPKPHDAVNTVAEGTRLAVERGTRR
jgi:hypothetical protein